MFLIVILTAFILSIFFTFIGLRMQKRFPDGTPALLLFIMYIIQFAIFTVLINRIGVLSGGLLVALGFAIALPPFCVLGLQISQLFSNTISDFLFAGSMVSKAPLTYGKARALLNQGDIEGAVQSYIKYFEEDSSVPDPLYQAASILIRQGRLTEAADLYRKLMHHFKADIPIWAKATFELAQLLELQIKDTEAAEVLYSQLIIRGRGTEPGKLASNRQIQRSDPAQSQNA